MPARIHLSVPPGYRVPRRLLTDAVAATLESEGAGDAEVAVVLLPDRPMRALNREWLEHDRVTDVLTFPLHDPGDPPFGDVYVGIEQAKRQAEEHGVSRNEELVRLVVHGTLHLLGHDHAKGAGPDSADDFFRRQEALVDSLAGGRGGRGKSKGDENESAQRGRR